MFQKHWFALKTENFRIIEEYAGKVGNRSQAVVYTPQYMFMATHSQWELSFRTLYYTAHVRIDFLQLCTLVSAWLIIFSVLLPWKWQKVFISCLFSSFCLNACYYSLILRFELCAWAFFSSSSYLIFVLFIRDV